MTKQTKSPAHAPLPWKQDRSDPSEIVDATGNHLIARTFAIYEGEDNASIIVSAVNSHAADKALIGELLEALETLLQYQIDSLLDDDYSEDQIAEMEDIKQARAAIARAKGAA